MPKLSLGYTAPVLITPAKIVDELSKGDPTTYNEMLLNVVDSCKNFVHRDKPVDQLEVYYTDLIYHILIHNFNEPLLQEEVLSYLISLDPVRAFNEAKKFIQDDNWSIPKKERCLRSLLNGCRRCKNRACVLEFLPSLKYMPIDADLVDLRDSIVENITKEAQ